MSAAPTLPWTEAGTAYRHKNAGDGIVYVVTIVHDDLWAEADVYRHGQFSPSLPDAFSAQSLRKSFEVCRTPLKGGFCEQVRRAVLGPNPETSRPEIVAYLSIFRKDLTVLRQCSPRAVLLRTRALPI